MVVRGFVKGVLAAAFAAFAPFIGPHHGAARAFCIDCDWVQVREYVNATTGHYLLLPGGDPENTAVQQGAAGPGWELTGNDFFTVTGAPQPVCRFYSPVFNTHFYTADAGECAAVKGNRDWVYEKSPFNVVVPANGACPAGLQPVYRLYRAFDHRYTADGALRSGMLAKGWVDEGVAFCTQQGGRSALFALTLSPSQIVSGTTAGNADLVVDSLPALSIRVPPYVPPNYITANADYPANANRLTSGPAQVDLWTSQGDPAQILQHSFASLNGPLYIDGHERTGGAYAGISPMLQLGPVNPLPDTRLFPWNHATDRELRIGAYVSVGIVAQDGAGSHAYGHPLVQFADARSGHTFLVTVQAYGTVPPGDFVGRDARTGETIVSTVFRADPRFGTVLAGAFTACRGDGSTQCMPASQRFSFSLERAGFRAALDLARTVDPTLSADPADYFVTRYGFHNETYLDARLGASITGTTLQLWYVE